MFRPNVGTTDRDVRLVLAALFGLIALFTPFGLGGLWQVIPAILALVMLVTAAMAFCPLYSIFGINTCRTGKQKASTAE